MQETALPRSEMMRRVSTRRAMLGHAGLLVPQPRRHIMGMSPPIPLPTYTVDMVRAFPDDGQRYELVEGILLVTPAPPSDHQIVVARLTAALIGYLGPHGPAHVVTPGEIEIAPKLHLEPDILVFPATFPPGSKWTDIHDWWLAVEVLSPSSRHYDRDYKLEAYLRVGVDEVWLVDLERQAIDVSARDGRRLVPHDRTVTWHPAALPAPLHLAADELFHGLP